MWELLTAFSILWLVHILAWYILFRVVIDIDNFIIAQFLSTSFLLRCFCPIFLAKWINILQFFFATAVSGLWRTYCRLDLDITLKLGQEYFRVWTIPFLCSRPFTGQDGHQIPGRATLPKGLFGRRYSTWPVFFGSFSGAEWPFYQRNCSSHHANAPLCTVSLLYLMKCSHEMFLLLLYHGGRP